MTGSRTTICYKNGDRTTLSTSKKGVSTRTTSYTTSGRNRYKLQGGVRITTSLNSKGKETVYMTSTDCTGVRKQQTLFKNNMSTTKREKTAKIKMLRSRRRLSAGDHQYVEENPTMMVRITPATKERRNFDIDGWVVTVMCFLFAVTLILHN